MNKSIEFKYSKLGMNPSTASNRLVKSLLFKFVSDAGIPCFHCGLPLQRENFSIEHKIPWLHAPDPKQMFFDLENISFSHHRCNVRAASRPTKLSKEERLARKRRYDMEWRKRRKESLKMAEGIGVEPTIPFGMTVFKTAGLANAQTLRGALAEIRTP